MQKNRGGQGKKAGGTYVENNRGDWDEVVCDGNGGRCISHECVFENGSFFASGSCSFPSDRALSVGYTVGPHWREDMPDNTIGVGFTVGRG